MQVGFFSMDSAALPKKPGHPSPARIPYVRVLVQNKKAARAQQGLSVYYQKPRHLASFSSLNSPIGRKPRHKCRERKKHKNRTPHLYQQKAPSTNATEIRSTKALLLISILPKLLAQMHQKEEAQKPSPSSSHFSQPIGGQRKGCQRLGVLNFPVCYLFPHFGERDFDDVQKFIRVQML